MFKYKEYIKLLSEGGAKKAELYRISKMPNKLYKYVSLSDRKIRDGIKIDTMKFKDLENKRMWLSTFNYLNDPYELKGVYLDDDKIVEYDYEQWIPFFRQKLEEYRSMFLIGSLTTHLNDNLPMWAHYSNNHHGICIEYEVQNASHIYKVSYEDSRQGMATLIINILNNVIDDYENKNEEISEESEYYSMILFNTVMMKHNTWKYEDEYRILYHNINNMDKGESILLEELGLKISKIYIGINCVKEYIDKLKEISKSIGCELYQMYFDEKGKSFALSYRKID